MRLYAIYNAGNDAFRIMGGEDDGDWLPEIEGCCLVTDKKQATDIINRWPEMHLSLCAFELIPSPDLCGECYGINDLNDDLGEFVGKNSAGIEVPLCKQCFYVKFGYNTAER